MSGLVLFTMLFSSFVSFAAPVGAVPLVKAPVQVSVGSTKNVGETFAYRLTYTCENTGGPCLNAQVVDLLPAEVQLVSTVPASPTGDVAAINVTPNHMGSGRTRVQFVMITPLASGNAGDLLINVRFPNGSTPAGTVASNTADGINLETTPGTFTTPPTTVTAVATMTVDLQATLTSGPANLDLPETYRLRIGVPNEDGALNLTAVGPVELTPAPGTVFNGATPAADCQPGCVGTTPATVTWTAPCTVPLTPNQNCDITVNVTFPSATFPSGTSVTPSFTVDATPLGETPQGFGPATVTHTVTTFVANPAATLQASMAANTANPPTLIQTFAYDLSIANSGNVPLDNLVVIDTLPVEFEVTSLTTGAYTNLSDVGAGEGVRVSYEKNTALGVFTLWGSSPNTATDTTLTSPPPGLGAGEYVTRIRWEFGQSQPGMTSSTPPTISGRIINPDNAGSPVAIGDTVQNCASLSAVYTAGPTPVNQSDCESFIVSGPFVQLNPAKENLSGGGPFNPGQNVSWRLRVRSDARSSNPAPLEDIVVTDLLPRDILYQSWTYDDQATGLPAPQVFDQIPNYAGTGRTLLRWRWNAGSSNLGVNQQVWVNVTTTVRNGAQAGTLATDVTLDSDAPGLALRCTGSSQTDALDFDGDADTAETLCRATGTVTIASIAQLVSSKTITQVCATEVATSAAEAAPGCAVEFTIRIQNVGTVPMQNATLIDLLPAVGDTNVRDTNPRGSEFSMLLTAPIVGPPGTTISYSTASNPCRSEVGGPTTGCDAPNWTATAPSPIETVRAIRVDMANVIQPFDIVMLSFVMTVPISTPVDAVTYNSFAYATERSDGFGWLAAEPQKVSVTATAATGGRIGDFVWDDLNGDGTQDSGEPGVNGVVVHLINASSGLLATSPRDNALATTSTTSSSGGMPGWYTFVDVPAGTYRVCVDAPLTTTFSPQGSSSATDSNVDQDTGCSERFTLLSGEINPDVDAGLISTDTAAVAGYAWADRNTDGLQNETVLDGINGVTVLLYAQPAGGSPDPGTALLIGSTQTTNDTFGRPGYYRFDGVTPGTNHFVQVLLPSAASSFTGQDQGGNDLVDSDVATSNGVSAFVTLTAGTVTDLDAGLLLPSGTLALGDQIWAEADNDGIFEPQNGELGIDGVRLELYADMNTDGKPSSGEMVQSTTSVTTSGFAGRYRFTNLPTGTYIVVVPGSNFEIEGALYGYSTSVGNDPAPDPDDDVNGDDNGRQVDVVLQTLPVTLTDNGEPTSEDGNNDTNLTVDLGFINVVDAAFLDYGDAPDAGAGTGFQNYNTTAFDNGAAHTLEGTDAFLGQCWDADSGLAANLSATADDTNPGYTGGIVCATGPDDDDGVMFPATLRTTTTAQVAVTTTGSCVVTGWIDWDQNGVFGNSAHEQIANDLAIDATTSVLDVVVPADAAVGYTYARFRCSMTTGVGPTGTVTGGEVEDYRVTVNDDDTAPTTTATGTANTLPYTFDTWTNQNVVVTLFPTDGDGSGVATTHYAVDDESCMPTALASCLTYTAPFTVSVAGVHTVRFFSVDAVGNAEDLHVVVVRIERTAPTSSASATANALPHTFGVWTQQNVTVTLSASDGDSGVAGTYYSIDDATCDDPTDVACTLYTVPFAITSEGQHTLRFFSVDTAGNLEMVQSVAANIDRTAPVLTVPANIVDVRGTTTGAIVTFSVTATDNLDTTPTVVCNPASGSRFPLGTRTVNCTATDDAGNVSSSSFTVTVRNGAVSLLDLQKQIDRTSTGRGQKLAMIFITLSAQSAVKANNVQGACGGMEVLEAYINAQVSTGAIKAADATKLFAKINAVRSNLGCGPNRGP